MREEDFWMYTNPFFIIYAITLTIWLAVWRYTTISDWYYVHFKLDTASISALEVFANMDTKIRWYWPHKAWVNRAAKKKSKKLIKAFTVSVTRKYPDYKNLNWED